MFTVQQVSDPAALRALAPEWDALASQISPYLPFRSATWNEVWWTHFRRQSGVAQDDCWVHTVRDGTGRLVGIAPLMRTTARVAGLPLVRVLRFFGADPFMTELRGLVCRREDQRAVLAALSRD